MNREQILAMEAGEELDRTVIRELMHHIWDSNKTQPRCEICGVWKSWPNSAFIGCEGKKYSTDISAAWQVVEKMGGGTDIVQIAVVYQLHFGEWIYRVTINFQDVNKKSITVLGKTAPEAISKVALLAKLEVKEK